MMCCLPGGTQALRNRVTCIVIRLIILFKIHPRIELDNIIRITWDSHIYIYICGEGHSCQWNLLHRGQLTEGLSVLAGKVQQHRACQTCSCWDRTSVLSDAVFVSVRMSLAHGPILNNIGVALDYQLLLWPRQDTWNTYEVPWGLFQMIKSLRGRQIQWERQKITDSKVIS
jgi:hypothetical protein